MYVADDLSTPNRHDHITGLDLHVVWILLGDLPRNKPKSALADTRSNPACFIFRGVHKLIDRDLGVLTDTEGGLVSQEDLKPRTGLGDYRVVEEDRLGCLRGQFLVVTHNRDVALDRGNDAGLRRGRRLMSETDKYDANKDSNDHQNLSFTPSEYSLDSLA